MKRSKRNTWLWLGLMASLSMPAAQAADNNKAQGQALCQAGRYAEAVPYLERAVKQNRRSGALWYLAIARQHLYDYDGALEALDAYMPVLHSDEWLERADSLRTMCEIGQRALEHTQDVVVIDSMLMGRDELVTCYRLGAESGRLVADGDGIAYENPAGDHRIWSDGTRLMESHRFQDEWDEARPMAGIGAVDCSIITPYMRTDGVTLYFACDSLPGLGGYDIYRTTYDANADAYYQPERLGMPFNSPYDDYMLAIDETHQVGWWATNRHAPKDSVTVYLFLLPGEEEYVDEPTASRARLDCIADTWRVPGGYATLVDELLNAEQQAVEAAPQLRIVVGDGRVYTSENDFRVASAREAYRRSLELAQQIAQTEDRLQELRRTYASADSDSRRAAMRESMLRDEDRLLQLYAQQRAAVTEYRKRESGEL